MKLYEEAFPERDGNLNVDEENLVIRNVKILGSRSPSRSRVYTEKAMREAAKLYDHCTVNVDHYYEKDGPDRPVGDGFGTLLNISVKESGVFGDLHYLKKSPARTFSCGACQADASYVRALASCRWPIIPQRRADVH